MGVNHFYERIRGRTKFHLNLWELVMGISHFHGIFCGNLQDFGAFTVKSLEKKNIKFILPNRKRRKMLFH